MMMINKSLLHKRLNFMLNETFDVEFDYGRIIKCSMLCERIQDTQGVNCLAK
jgi:hypothetical protein